MRHTSLTATIGKQRQTKFGWIGSCCYFTTMPYIKEISFAECVTELDYQSKLITCGSLLFTIEASFIFEAVGAAAEIGPSIKRNQHNQV